MPLKINSTNGSVTITPIDGVGNADITVPRGNIVSEDYAGELVVDSYNERYSAVTSSSNATTVNCEDANSFSHTLTENTTFTFSNPPASGTAYTFSIEIIQDASASGYTVTWPTAVDWPSATAPTLTATASAKDLFVFYTRDGGTNWYGFTAGQALGQVMAIKKKLLQVSGAEQDDYWIAVIGGSEPVDRGFDVAADSSNNVIMTGIGRSDGAGVNDGLIVKYDPEGSVLWDRTLGGTSTDEFYRIAIDSSDNIIATGREASVDAGGYDMFIAKYNSSGTIQWQRRLGGTGNDYFYGVGVDSSDNIYASGYTASAGAGGEDALIVKYNSSGTLQWQRTLGDSNTNRSWDLAVDSSDDIIIGGVTGSVFSGLLAKYNSSGTLQWSRSIGGSGSENIYGIAVDSSDNIIFTGSTTSDGAGGTSFLVGKCNSSGVLQWKKTLGGTGTDNGYGVAVDSNDNIIINGLTGSDGGGTFAWLIAKYNSSGTLQWQKNLSGTGSDFGRGVAVDAKNNVLVTGWVDLTVSATLSDWAVTAKLPTDGSGDGTYGDLTYEDAALTETTSSVTDAAVSLTDASSSLTDAALSLTDAAAVLTETLYTVT